MPPSCVAGVLRAAAGKYHTFPPARRRVNHTRSAVHVNPDLNVPDHTFSHSNRRACRWRVHAKSCRRRRCAVCMPGRSAIVPIMRSVGLHPRRHRGSSLSLAWRGRGRIWLRHGVRVLMPAAPTPVCRICETSASVTTIGKKRPLKAPELPIRVGRGREWAGASMAQTHPAPRYAWRRCGVLPVRRMVRDWRLHHFPAPLRGACTR